MPERPAVLDVGARDFAFTRAILERWPYARVVAMEPDPDVRPPADISMLFTFLNAALVGDDRKESGYAQFSTGEGNFLTDAESYYDARMLRVPCVGLSEVTIGSWPLRKWDLVKLDCEGSEFGILENWPGPIATQITCEMHDYSDPAKYSVEFYAALFARLPWYEVRQHELSRLAPNQPPGHWDTWMVLRP